MREDVEKLFDAALVETFSSKPDLLRFLQKHERRELVLKNLCYQILQLEDGLLRKFDQNKYRYVIKEVAKFFASTAIEAKRQELLSGSERSRIAAQESAMREAESMLEEENKDGLRTKIYMSH